MELLLPGGYALILVLQAALLVRAVKLPDPRRRGYCWVWKPSPWRLPPVCRWFLTSFPAAA